LSRARGWLADALALLGIGWIGFACLHKFNGGFDALAYHLPFAALRAGILTPAQFMLPPLLADRLAGFPPLADWVQGGLWRLFGRPEAAALIAPLGVLAFAIYARAAFGLGMIWSTLIFLAVPILHTALDGMYVDLWTNAAFAIHLLAAFRAVTARGRAAGDAAVSMLALGVAVWSKPQFAVVGAVSLTLISGLLAWRDRRALLVCVVLAPLAFFWPLRNAAMFGNPFYPMAITLGPLARPGTQTNTWEGPAALRGVPEAVRTLLSLLDLDAVNQRPHGYMLDQGYQPSGTPGFRMGGSLSVLLLASLALLGIGLSRAPPRPDVARAGVALLVLAAVVVNLPGAHELRYFSFLEILAIFAALAVLRAGATADPYVGGLATALRALLASAAIYTAFITGFVHLTARHQPSLADMARADAAGNRLAERLAGTDTLCDARGDFRGLLSTRLLLPEGAARVVEAYGPSDCPAGAAVLGP
jgi:hypothetical protein